MKKETNKDDYQLVKAILIAVDGLPLEEQIAKVSIRCKKHPELIDSIIEMLTGNAQNNGSDKQDIFSNPPILEYISDDAIGDQENILSAGTQINQYSIVEKIGSGGMGIVYSAKQQFPAERLVALKLINHLPNQEQLIKETNTLAQLNHPNIATLFEIDKFEIDKFEIDETNTSDKGRLYIAMELIEGQDLIHWCETYR